MLRTLGRCSLALLICSFLAFTPSRTALAQSSDAGSAARALVTSKVVDSKLVSYKNSIPAEVKAAQVEGRADPSMVMEGQIVLHRAPEMQIAVDLLQQRLHTKGDPLYHQWLTPQELAAMFGPAQSDITALENWMTAHDLTVVSYQPSQLVVLFTGHVSSVEEAFHTKIFDYRTADGAVHYSNGTNPKVPAALNPLILSPLMLNDFSPIHMQNYAGEVVGAAKSPAPPAKNGIAGPKEEEQVNPAATPDAVSLSTFTLTDTPGTQTQGTSTAQTLVVTLKGSTSAGAITGTLTITNPTIGTIESTTVTGTGCTEGTSTHSYTCTFTWDPSATLAGGAYTLTATYGGNTAYSAETTTATFTVLGSTANTTTDTANPTVVDFNTPSTTVTSTTTWTGTGATPTGTVKLSCSAASAGTCSALPAAVTVNTTNCTINTTAKTFACPVSYALDSEDSDFGTYYMVMTYSGDGTYTSSASTASPAQVVDSEGDDVGITISPNPTSVVQGAGTTVMYTVTLVDEDEVEEPFTGTLSLSGTPLTTSPVTINLTTCSQTVNDDFEEVATCTISSAVPVATAIGNYTVTAAYSGDDNYEGINGTATVSVTGSTATSMTSSANPTLVFDGTAAQQTTTVTSVTTWTGSGATPTGTVTLSCGAGSAGTCNTLPAAKNVTTCTINTTAKTITCAIAYRLDEDDTSDGTYNMVSTYSGDATYTGASSTVQVIDSEDNEVGVTVSANPSSVAQGAGTTVTYTVTLTDEFEVEEPFTGTVTFSGTPLTTSPVVVNLSTCSQSVNADFEEVAVCTITSAVPVATAFGSYTLTAAYSGDGNYGPTTGTGTLSVTGSTPTSMTSSANPTYVDINTPSTTVTSITTWTGTGATPTGTVTLSCGTPSAGMCNTLPAAKNVSSCTINTTAKTITCAIAYALDDDDTNFGSYTLVSTYSGDTTYEGASSSVTVIDSEGTDASTTTVVAAPTSVVYGAGTSVTYTASVVGGAGEGRPSGSVAFSGTPITGTPLSGNIVSANCTHTGTGTSSYIYTCPVAVTAVVPVATAVGTYTITATYGSNATYAPSTGTTTLTVTKPTPTAAASNESGGFESTVTLSATDTGVSGAAAPTGTVTFTVNSATVSGTPACTSSSDEETCTLSYTLPGTLTAGSYSITAMFAADTNYNASNTATATLTVTADATSTSVSASPSSITAAQTTVFTATVTNSTVAAVAPTGTVTFTLGSTGGTQVGSCTLSAGACSSAAVSGATLGTGTDTVYANYPGVTNEFGASSSSTTVTVSSSAPPNGYITFTSVSHDFGQVAVGTAATTYGLTITNTSTTTAYPFSLNFTAANGFTSANNCPATIAAGAKCQLDFYFTPTATGPVSATWSLASETGFGYTPADGGLLQGSGTSQGGVSLTTNGHNFGTVAVGSSSPVYGTELSNSTTTAESVVLGPVPAGPFTMVTNCGTTLAAGSSCEIEFTFTPTSTSTVSVVVPLSGTPTTIMTGGAALPSGGITLSGN